MSPNSRILITGRSQTSRSLDWAHSYLNWILGDRIAELLMRSFRLLVEENKNKKLEFNFNPNAFLIISEDRSLVMEFVNSGRRYGF